MRFAFALFPLSALLAAGGAAQILADSSDRADTRVALERALAERQAAEQRSQRLETAAAEAQDAAEKTAREAAALAARIQQAEAGIDAAEARIELVDRERRTLREQLGREQQPVVELTAALQQFSRRPVALAMLRPGSVKDVVYLRAVLSSALPSVAERTEELRTRLERSRQFQAAAVQAAGVLRAEEDELDQRRNALAAIETRQRLASRQASGNASREAERALALAEEARDLDALVGELDRAAGLRQVLAGLPGPKLRPARPENARVAASEESAPPDALEAAPPPSPYTLPVVGRVAMGFGAAQGAGLSEGVTLVPHGGAQVVAPAAGRVAFAGPYRGYGRIVIVEHDGGWTSLVTGLARINVEAGQELVGGAPIGTAGRSDPAVSLELRRGLEPVNPLAFAD